MPPPAASTTSIPGVVPTDANQAALLEALLKQHLAAGLTATTGATGTTNVAPQQAAQQPAASASAAPQQQQNPAFEQ